MLPLQSRTIPAAPLSHCDRPGVSQHQDVASGGLSSSRARAFAGIRNPGLGEQESHANVDGFPFQNVNVRGQMHGERSRGDTAAKQKRRGRSPRRRKVEKLRLAVSSGFL